MHSSCIEFIVNRRYFPAPRYPVTIFKVDPAYAHLGLHKTNRKTPPSSLPIRVTNDPARSNLSNPAFLHFEESEVHSKYNQTAISVIRTNSKIDYNNESNRYSNHFNRAERRTAYQFQGGSSFPRSVLKKTRSTDKDYRTSITDARRESRNPLRDYRDIKRRSASLEYYRASRSYDRTYTYPRTRSRKSYSISPIRIPIGQIKSKHYLANSIPVSSKSYSKASIHESRYYFPTPTYPSLEETLQPSALNFPILEIGLSPPPSPAPDLPKFYGQSYIPPEEELLNLDCYPHYHSTPTSPEPFYDPHFNYREPEQFNVEEVRHRFEYSPTTPSLSFPCESYSDWYYSNFKTWRRSRSTERSDRSGRSRSRMNAAEHERKVIIEFCHLLEKSKQLFNGLRELPPYGHKQWHSYFGRTFDVYTKLWKFQQQHREILDTKYGLKRWQIGEIASKIGQLYYHFYLRTSVTTYLNEAYSFYHAIRARSYYTKASEEDKCELMIKKLRYYARFIVVGLLLKKIKLVKDLVKELEKQIVEYGNVYDPNDQFEWTVVVEEVKDFIQGEQVVSVFHPDNYCAALTHRLGPSNVPLAERTSQMTHSLKEVVIVGNTLKQVKFSELTMDMFRMVQTLEREPTGDTPRIFEESPKPRQLPPGVNPSLVESNQETAPPPRLENPHKYLMFKPTPSEVLVFLASGCNDLPAGGVLLLYISADGHIVKSHLSQHIDQAGYDMGGVITSANTDFCRDCDPKNLPKYKEPQVLYPGDLHPFVRKPTVLIVDSNNSYAFQDVPRTFGQPLIIFMSPIDMPQQYMERKQYGNLFTMFLHSPLTAFCFICEIYNLSLTHWERAQVFVEKFIVEVSHLILKHRIEFAYVTFLGDDFIRLLIYRYVFCEVALRYHKAFKHRNQRPKCIPPLPEDLLEFPSLVQMMLDLATYMQVRNQFVEPVNQAIPSTSHSHSHAHK